MGPYATLSFYKSIIDLTPAPKDWDHLRILIDSNVKIPSRTRAILYNEASPAPGMVESINNLAKAGADFVVVPCNSAHWWYDEVAPRITIPWLNILEVTAKVIKGFGSDRPFVLGTYVVTSNRMYSKFLSSAVYPSDEEAQIVYAAIEDVKSYSRVSAETLAALTDLVGRYAGKVDSVILACTELCGLQDDLSSCGHPVIDSSLEYAKYTIQYGFGRQVSFPQPPVGEATRS